MWFTRVEFEIQVASCRAAAQRSDLSDKKNKTDIISSLATQRRRRSRRHYIIDKQRNAFRKLWPSIFAAFPAALIRRHIAAICSSVKHWRVFNTLNNWSRCFHSRPNVCVEREVMLVAQRQPCVQAFTRMVKVWKQGCVGQSWCMGYERRWVMRLICCLSFAAKTSDCA